MSARNNYCSESLVVLKSYTAKNGTRWNISGTRWYLRGTFAYGKIVLWQDARKLIEIVTRCHTNVARCCTNVACVSSFLMVKWYRVKLYVILRKLALDDTRMAPLWHLRGTLHYGKMIL